MGLVADLLLAGAMLSTGSLNTISNKILFQTETTNMGGEIQYYDRPWLATFIMFLGEMMCMLFFGLFALLYKFCIKSKDDEIEDDDPEKKKYQFISREEVTRNPTGGLGWKYPCFITLFASCDLFATTLAGIGLTFCNASIIQIIRGFVIVFTMLFAWPFLHRKPNAHQLLGVMFALIGLFIVGASAVLNNKSGNNGGNKHTIGNTILGIGLTLVGQLFSATQFCLEEKLLKQDSAKKTPIPPLFLVGSEGTAGSVLCAAIALPVVTAIKGNDFGSYENMKNSFYMLFHNSFITGIQFLYFISIAFFNWSSFVYSKALSATSRTLVDALRTIVVWIIMVIVYYSTDGDYGEPVSYWSILQAVGFCFMLLGTFTHNDVADIGTKMTRCCKKEIPKLEEEDENEMDTSELNALSDTNKKESSTDRKSSEEEDTLEIKENLCEEP